jgi:hypothetical protein
MCEETPQVAAGNAIFRSLEPSSLFRACDEHFAFFARLLRVVPEIVPRITASSRSAARREHTLEGVPRRALEWLCRDELDFEISRARRRRSGH